MANKSVHITKRVEVEKGVWRFCPAFESDNGRLKPDVVLVGGNEETHREGTYYIEWREGTTRKRKAVGANAQDALNAKNKQAALLNARNHGVEVVQEQSDSAHHPLATAIADWLAGIKRHPDKSAGTFKAYRKSLAYFAESCRKQYVEDVTRDDLQQFNEYLHNECELSARTRWNKFMHVVIFLKSCGVSGLAEKGDWPKFTEENVEVYSQEELDALFGACTTEERLLFEFFLMTGMRDKEVRHTSWRDVDFAHSQISVTRKPEWNWKPKANRERTIPVPDKLIEALRPRKGADKELVFPNGGGKPSTYFLATLKAVAKRAGIDPSAVWLHKFRSTFATRSLRGGVDLETMRYRLGHKDMKSTLRYLTPDDSPAAREKVNAIFA